MRHCPPGLEMSLEVEQTQRCWDPRWGRDWNLEAQRKVATEYYNLLT